MSAVLMRERDSGMVQLMSQGTADVVLDSCSDVWDGCDLVPLDDAYRKKIMDFFQRNNLASHCAALSYCPLGGFRFGIVFLVLFNILSRFYYYSPYNSRLGLIIGVS